MDWEDDDQDFQVRVEQGQVKVDKASKGRGLADEFEGHIDVFTVDQYRELFGAEPERFPGDPGFIDQN